jgi:hypothetical protein
VYLRESSSETAPRIIKKACIAHTELLSSSSLFFRTASGTKKLL